MNKYTRYIQAPYVPQYTPAPVSEIGQVLKEQKGLRDQAMLQDTTTQALIDSASIGSTPEEINVLKGLIGPEYEQINERVTSGDYYGQDANLKAKQAGVRVATTIRQFQNLQKQKSDDLDTFYSRNKDADPRAIAYTLSEYGTPRIIQKEDGTIGLSHTLSGIVLPDYQEPKEQEESLITTGYGAAPPIPVETFAEEVNFPESLTNIYTRELRTIKAANNTMTPEQEEFLLDRGFYRTERDSSGNIIQVPSRTRLYEDPFAFAEYKRLPSVQAPEVARRKYYTELVEEIQDPNAKAITTSIMDSILAVNPELAEPENDDVLQKRVQAGIQFYENNSGQIENATYERFTDEQYEDAQETYINKKRILSGMFIVPGKEPMDFKQLADKYKGDLKEEEFLDSIVLDGVIQDKTGLYSLSGESFSGTMLTKDGNVSISIDMGNYDPVKLNLMPTLKQLVNPFDFRTVEVTRGVLDEETGEVKQHDIKINKILRFMLNGKEVPADTPGAKPMYSYKATLDNGDEILYDNYEEIHDELLNPQM